MRTISLALIAATMMLTTACNSGNQPGKTTTTIAPSPKEKLVAGAVCTVEGEGRYGVVKILAIDDTIAHVRIYKNEFDERPATVDLKTLTLGKLSDKDGGLGVGHIPVPREEFEQWKPVVIANEKITEEELEGYKIWMAQ